MKQIKDADDLIKEMASTKKRSLEHFINKIQQSYVTVVNENFEKNLRKYMAQSPEHWMRGVKLFPTFFSKESLDIRQEDEFANLNDDELIELKKKFSIVK